MAAMAAVGRRVCVVQGASRGLGLELTRQLAARGDVVFATCRDPPRAEALQALQRQHAQTVGVLQLDVRQPASIEEAAAHVAAHPLAAASASGRPAVDLLVNVAGVLQDKDSGLVPERALRQVNAEAMAASFAINSIGPLLVAKSFAPLLSSVAQHAADDAEASAPRRLARAVFYSARVGSIGDNMSGGWYSYRASKAALNQFVRCMSHELRKSRVCCVAIHPGTVDTDLTRAFLKARAKYEVQTVEDAVANHLTIFDSLSMEDSGSFLDWRRDQVPW